MRIKIAATVATALVGAVLLAGCTSGGNMDNMKDMPGMNNNQNSNDNNSSSTKKSDMNAADSMFATMMIPHHEQAVEMSDMVLNKQDISDEIRQLAQQIKDAQGPEIKTMKDWLESWGTPYDPSAAMSMDMGDDGMMSDQSMKDLEAATGAAAERLFLEGMIVHHRGAIKMAQDELKGGKNADALKLAQDIIDSQTAEITAMETLLATR